MYIIVRTSQDLYYIQKKLWSYMGMNKSYKLQVFKNKYSYLYLKVGYKDTIGTIGPVLIVGERRTVFLLVYRT